MVFPLGDSQPTRIVPVITYLLIGLNILMFIVQNFRDEAFTVALAATPIEITRNIDIPGPIVVGDPEPGVPPEFPDRRVVIPQARVPFPVRWTLLTAMFLHTTPLHLVGNLLFLWIFGDNVEEVLGSGRYLLAYLACGVVATMSYIAAAPDSPISTLGASGAVAGVMGAYLVWFPYNRVRVLVVRVVVEVPALLVIGLWIGFQIWRGAGSIRHLREVGGVAYLAHVCGAITGFIVAYLFRDRARALGRPTLFDRVMLNSLQRRILGKSSMTVLIFSSVRSPGAKAWTARTWPPPQRTTVISASEAIS